ncbi:hypothetical protein VIAQ111709_18960 [Vibrio aquimaris]|uniref:Uncharacterized protein n=1 Tax=Vibrio aquimaris TaxID=2587862 RepID=A0A5P9CMP0_9VIBR|nr:hypothetical protein FIV01_13810 [Vibrio aquimaris]
MLWIDYYFYTLSTQSTDLSTDGKEMAKSG